MQGTNFPLVKFKKISKLGSKSFFYASRGIVDKFYASRGKFYVLKVSACIIQPQTAQILFYVSRGNHTY